MDYERSQGINTPLTVDEMMIKSARDRGIELDIRPAADLIFPLRRIKSESEIGIINRAVKISSEAHKEMMRSAEPGMYEFQLQGIGEYVFKFNGAQEPGYSSIVGSGINGCVLHWSENSRKMEDGDMVVIDMGCFYEYYTADITRSFPVNGKFTERQKQIYEIVLAANKGAIEMIRPGVAMSEISRKARDIISEGLIKIGLIENPMDVRRYYMHGLGHNIGLNVHDVGGLDVLEPGMILTIEPGIYIREENMGIRIEDDVLVTDSGHTVLSEDCPKEIKDVEKMMAEKGMDFARYRVKK